TGRQRDGRARAVLLLLMQRDGARNADHDLAALRVHLPRRPRLREAMHRNEPTFGAVGGVPAYVVHVPLDAARELGLDDRGDAEPQVDRVDGQVVWHRFASPAPSCVETVYSRPLISTARL